MRHNARLILSSANRITNPLTESLNRANRRFDRVAASGSTSFPKFSGLIELSFLASTGGFRRTALDISLPRRDDLSIFRSATKSLDRTRLEKKKSCDIKRVRNNKSSRVTSRLFSRFLNFSFLSFLFFFFLYRFHHRR